MAAGGDTRPTVPAFSQGTLGRVRPVYENQMRCRRERALLSPGGTAVNPRSLHPLPD